ncbi:MAG: hypothetical protein JRG74_02430 [Deltaproteobacteria bacterium]|nr:hypothetical protein [Deltaproteobacteria bacterium]MBW1833353.1 hypothetical protein [Deltaproteobacteria bacterium]MBW2164980.1 hypothetical protein [Deltaproteobacteria bacterium]
MKCKQEFRHGKKQILNVSQGVWIDEQWLHKAGLGSRLQVEMKTGEIRIHAASEITEEAKPSKKGWKTFHTLGDNAVTGCLKNAAQNHDRYLLGG